MSPEKIIIDPVAAPFLMGMVARTKGFVVTKGMTVIITASMAIGAAAYKLDATEKRLAGIEQTMIAMQENMNFMKTALALTNKDIRYIIIDINKLTAQVGEMISNKAKIRK